MPHPPDLLFHNPTSAFHHAGVEPPHAPTRAWARFLPDVYLTKEQHDAAVDRFGRYFSCYGGCGVSPNPRPEVHAASVCAGRRGGDDARRERDCDPGAKLQPNAAQRRALAGTRVCKGGAPAGYRHAVQVPRGGESTTGWGTRCAVVGDSAGARAAQQLLLDRRRLQRRLDQ